MESSHFLSPRQIHELVRGDGVGPFSLCCPLINRISHATLTLYWGYGRPLTLRFSQDSPVDPLCVKVAFDEVEGDGWRHLTVKLLDEDEEGESRPLSESASRRVFWIPSKQWAAASNKLLTSGLLTVGFHPLWRTQPSRQPLAQDNAVTPTETVNKERNSKGKAEEKPYRESFWGRKSLIRHRGKIVPSSLQLQVRLTPVWLENDTACAQVDGNEPCALYPRRAAFCEVQAEFTGIGYHQILSGGDPVPFIGTDFLTYRLIVPQPFLYRKVFKTQPEGRLICRNPSETGVDGVPYLWAYGGQQSGDDIHPFVLSMDSVRRETVVESSSLLYWRKQGFYPANAASGEEGVFQDAFEEDQTRTLCESIEAGMSVIHLEIVGGTGQPVRVAYESYQLSKNFIFYKKQEQP